MANKRIRFLFLKIASICFLFIGLTDCSNDATKTSSETLVNDHSNTVDDANSAISEEITLDLPLEVDTTLVKEIRNRNDVVLVDVRESWEYDEGHIPGVTLIPLGQIQARLDEIPTDKTVVVVCRSGNRSGKATTFFRQQGLDNVHNMQGGMLAWEVSGYEIEQGKD